MDTKIVDKIKKLLALSKSSNENEAILAYQMAQELLTKHNLSLDDIQVDINILEETISSGDEWEEWKFLLYSVIANCNFCQLVVTSYNNKTYRYNLIGREHNIIIVKEMYQYLADTIEKLHIEKGRKLNSDYEKSGLALTEKAFNSIRYGIVKGICTRLLESKNQMKKEGFTDKIKKTFFREETKAIIISKFYDEETKKINQYLDSKYKDIKHIESSDSGYINKFVFEGQQESKKIGLNKQINKGDANE